MTLDPLGALPPDLQARLLQAAATPAAPVAPIGPVTPKRILRDARDTDPLAVQLVNEPFPLNEEQQAITQAVVADRLDTVVRAKAGTGKTSTLEALARRIDIRTPGTRILYVAFNKAVSVEAEMRMPPNVESRTGHSLAWGHLPVTITGKIARDRLAEVHPEISASDELRFLRSRPKAIGNALRISPQDGETVRLLVDVFANSADDELSMDHLDALASTREIPDGPGPRRKLLAAAQRFWDDVSRPLGKGRCQFMPSQDQLRKMWALSRPDFRLHGSGVRVPAQVVFLDEAQDTPPVLARVIREQAPEVQRVVVGDESQAIYGFSGATDYLSEAATSMGADLPLTTSYRFGPKISQIANRFLEELGVEELVRGAAGPDQVGWMQDADAVLTRTNAGMIEEIGRETERGRRVGLLPETRADLMALIDTTYHLRDGGPRPPQKHKALGRFDSWEAALEELEQVKGGSDFTVAMNIVKRWTLPQLRRFASESVQVHDVKRSGCDVVVVTAHKAKGLEWDAVRIGGDFYGPDRKPPKHSGTQFDDPEHLRLNYVAVTRAKKRLDLGSLGWIREYDRGAVVRAA